MRIFALAAWLAVPGVLRAQSYTETFEHGVNDGGWSLSPGVAGAIISTGGNPGAYFGGASSRYPDFRTGGASTFTGNFVDRGVAIITVTLIVMSGQGASYPPTLVLVHDNGTQDPSDDWGASVLSGGQALKPGLGWRWHEFMIPTVSANTPLGWKLSRVDGLPVGAGQDWPTLVRNVSQVRFLFAPLGTLGGGEEWTVGIDQVSTNTCYPNLYPFPIQNPPILNANDFNTFMGMYAAGCASPANCLANCDGSTVAPVLNFNDFLCFINRYAAGCN